MNRGATTGRLLLRAFIAFRIETSSGDIFLRANLIKARRTGLLNEQTVHRSMRLRRRDAAMAAKALAGGGATQANAILCLSFSHFTPVVACCAQPAQRHRGRRSFWSSGLFQLIPHLPTGEMSFAKRSEPAFEIYINIFDARRNPLFCVCYFFHNCFAFLLYNQMKTRRLCLVKRQET